MRPKYWTKVREEASGNGEGGGGGDTGPSSFVKLAGERARGDKAGQTQVGLNTDNGGEAPPKPSEFQKMEVPGDKLGTPGTPDPKPAETKVETKENSPAVEADLAKMLLGVLKPGTTEKPGDKSVTKEQQDDPLKDILGDMPEPPPAGSPIGEQFEHVKSVGAKYKAKLVETVAEIKALKASNMTIEDRARLKLLNDEKEALTEANATLKKEQEDIRRRLAAYDLREDPEFQRLYVEPVKAKEKEVIEMIGMMGGNHPDDLRQKCTSALATGDEAQFRLQVNEIAESLGGFDGADIRREMFNLRKLYTAQNAAQSDLDTTSLNVTKSKAERGKLAATAFLDRDVGDSINQMAQNDPMIAMLGTDAARSVLAKHVALLDKYDKQIDQSVSEETSRRGGISKELAPVVAMAKIRVRERIIFGQALEQLQAQAAENADLRAQYRKATGKDFIGSGGTPDKNDKGGDGGGDEPVGLVGFARKQGVFQ